MFEKVVLPDEKSGFFPSRSPLFEQVKASIIKKIQQGVWHHDDVLPNEIELAKIFNVSQGTIRRALKELVQEGFLVRKQGKGTYVSSYEAEFDAFYSKFVPIKADDPAQKWKTYVRMTDYEEIAPTPRVCHLMGITDTTEVIIHIKRQHYSQLENKDKVDCFDELFLRKRFFPSLTRERFLGQKDSLYAFYQRAFDVTIIHRRDILKATLLNAEQAKSAGVPVPYPAIIQQSQAFDINDNLVELRYLTTITDYCHYEVLR